MAKTVKMQDIAGRIGVSTMTVSKALSGKSGVSEETREKIKQLAEEMGYVAPGGEKDDIKKSYNIGVLLSEYYTSSSATFYWRLYQEICTGAVDKNCFVMLEILSTADETERRIPKLLQEKKIDGLIILGSVESEYLKNLEQKNSVPLVYMDFYDTSVREDSVISNSFYGTYRITNYLLEKGHKDIAFVGTIKANMSIMDRYLGYQKALLEHGREPEKEWIIPDRGQEREGFDVIKLPEKMPTAFVCNCDIVASKVIKELNEANYRVPEDISVVGYDDYIYPGLCNVGITSYGVDMGHMACKGIKVLLNKIEGKSFHKSLHIIEGYLVERNSVRSL